ncbi:MAG: hypothetical protein ACRDSH_23775, partial [Pseudonocardiaceae bacterium]
RHPLAKPINLLEHRPGRIESQNCILDTGPERCLADVIADGQKMNLHTYDGTFPSPTLVEKPGDILHIREHTVTFP